MFCSANIGDEQKKVFSISGVIFSNIGKKQNTHPTTELALTRV